MGVVKAVFVIDALFLQRAKTNRYHCHMANTRIHRWVLKLFIDSRSMIKCEDMQWAYYPRPRQTSPTNCYLAEYIAYY